MKIVHLIAGAGPMYCGSCMHGNTLAAALRKAGADILVAPVYTPLRTDEENVSIDRLSMGGINVYLDETMPFWRWMPAWVRRVLDRPSLVSWVARRGGSTRPAQLGRLTMAMFRGDQGPLKNDIHQLMDWLEVEVRPDIVHLSNVMLAGLARPLRQRLGVPVVATLSGEDSFLEKLPAPYYAQARAELRACAANLTGLVAMCEYYADFMADYLAVPRERFNVIRPGLNLDGHVPANLAKGNGGGHPTIAEGATAPRVKTIGFLSRICADKGLHLLVDALHAISKASDRSSCRLRVAGYLDRAERGYLDEIEKQVHALGLADRFEYAGELDRAGKQAFFQSLDILCLPSLIRESKGLPVLEAWACGVPAVLPDHGAFSNLVADTSGGLLYDPDRPGALAEALDRMLSDGGLREACGRRGQQAVHERYTSQREAQEMLTLYKRSCEVRDSH